VRTLNVSSVRSHPLIFWAATLFSDVAVRYRHSTRVAHPKSLKAGASLRGGRRALLEATFGAGVFTEVRRASARLRHNTVSVSWGLDARTLRFRATILRWRSYRDLCGNYCPRATTMTLHSVTPSRCRPTDA
jgi:hypothetical protein